METMDSAQQEQNILERLRSDDPSEQRAAAFDAGDMALQSAVPFLVDHFASSSVGVQEAAEYALRRIRGATTVQAVAPLLRVENTTARNIAMDILREIGVDDITTLTRLLYDQDPDIRIFISDILGSTGTSLALAPLCDVLLHDPEVNVRYQAAVSLGSLGYLEAAESLRLALNDEEWVQYAVIEALAKIKDASCVDILIQALDTCSPLVASTILDALGDINNVKAAPLLLGYLEKVSGPLRIKALKAIIQILGPNSLNLLGGKQLTRLQEYMLAALDDEDEDTVKVVLAGLATTGVNTNSTQAVLELAARTNPDKQQDLFQAEIHCLIGIGYNEVLEEALKSPQETIRAMAIEVCGRIPGRAGRYALKRHFDTMDLVDKKMAMVWLAQNGDDRDIPFFVNHLNIGENPEVLRPALHFLGVQMRYVESAPRMLELLNHEDEHVRESALEACLALEDENTLASIVAHSQDENPVLRRMAVYTMGAVNPMAFANELALAMQDPEADIRKVALEAVGYGWPPSPEKNEALAFALRDENRDVRLIAIELIGHNVEEETFPLLMEALQDVDDWVKVRAIEALGQYRISEAIPTLAVMMEDASLLVQIKITEALGHIGGDIAFQALMGMMTHEGPEIQQAAAQAIARIRGEEEYAS